MKVQITEEQFKLIVQNISEQKVIKGTGRDPWNYKQVGSKYYVAKKTSPNNWIEVKGSQKNAVAKMFGSSVDDDNSSWFSDKKTGTSSGSSFSPQDFAGLQLSDYTTDRFIQKLNPKKISTTSSVPIFNAGQDQCAQFVNDFSDKVGFVGDAWTAHNNRGLGSLVYTAFENLSPQVAKEIENLWLKIHSKGGGVKNGTYKSTVSKIVSKLAPTKPPITLQLDDVVGIYYPPSSFHELAFYEAGKPYFVDDVGGLDFWTLAMSTTSRKKSCSQTKDPKKCTQSVLDKQVNLNDTCKNLPKKLIEDGQLGDSTNKAIKMCNSGGGGKKAGKTITGGDAWGMNTHVGIVGAIKNGVPIIFHNIHGQVYADPVTKLNGGGRVVWVRRPSGGINLKPLEDLYDKGKKYVKNMFGL